LDQLEQRLCVITAKQLGYDINDVKPESRLIEDLHCDSLDAVELIMETEDEFGITIPDSPDTPVGKLIFTRQPFRVRDLAEYAFLNQGSGSPVRTIWRKRNADHSTVVRREFSQLGGRLDQQEHTSLNLLERLESAQEYMTFRRITDGMVCVHLPAAEFSVGSDKPDAQPDEGPPHAVSLSSFLIDIEPVSVTAFCRFLNSIDASGEELNALIGLRTNDDRCAQIQFAKLDDVWRPRIGTAMQPVVMVSWFAANAYSLWANGSDWRNHSAGESFLPSEAQWEYAAQGAFPTKDIEKIQAAVHQLGETYELGIMPIAEVHQSFGVSRHGLRHTSGTIWHWCRDWFDANFYHSPNSRLQDPLANECTGIRSERGGSWVGPIKLCQLTYRRGRPPEARGRCLGFRCVSFGPNQMLTV